MAGDSAWAPARDIEIIAGTPPGGGLDRVARALAAALTALPDLGVKAMVVNIPGDGARKAWGEVDRRAGDAHVLAISSPNLTTDRLVGLANFDHSAYTPLAILCTEYIAFAARAESAMKSGGDLVRRLAENAGGVTVALSTALGNPNHIAFAKVIRAAGAAVTAPKIRVFDTALDAVADMLDGHADIAAVTAASVLAELNAGRLRVLAVSAPGRLAGPLSAAPTWGEQSVDCTIGAWRGVSGAQGLTAAQIDFWQATFRAAVQTPEWQAALARHAWTDLYLDGKKLRDHLTREGQEMKAMLGELGLLKL
jgi:putative tricarboxylic transport membrane protein